MCFVLSWKTWFFAFFAIWKALLLSQNKVTGLTLVIPDSSNNLTTQVTLAVVAISLYSASDEDLLIVLRFLDFQEIGDLPNKRL